MLVKKLRFTDKQLDKTSDMLLDVAKTILLVTVIGFFIPGFGAKIGIEAFIAGFISSTIFYICGILLIKEVKD